MVYKYVEKPFYNNNYYCILQKLIKLGGLDRLLNRFYIENVWCFTMGSSENYCSFGNKWSGNGIIVVG